MHTITLPTATEVRKIAMSLAAIDILLRKERSVFSFEKEWQPGISAAFVDLGDGAQMSIKFAEASAIIKGTHLEAFMHPGATAPFSPQEQFGFKVFPGLLSGLPAGLVPLLTDADPFDDVCFCLWSENNSDWKRGSFEWPRDVDDPDCSEEMLAFFRQPIDAVLERAKELYGIAIKDRHALEQIFAHSALNDEIVRGIGGQRPLSSCGAALDEIGYPRSPWQSAQEAGNVERPGSRGSGFLSNLFGQLSQDALANAITAMSDAITQTPDDSPIKREPLFKWERLTKSKLMLSGKTGMSDLLSTAATDALFLWRQDRNAAVSKFVASLERSFASKPEFLAQSFSELAGMYQREYPADAAMFKQKSAEWKSKKSTSASDGADIPIVKIVYEQRSASVSDGDLLERLLDILQKAGIEGFSASLEVVNPYNDSREANEVSIISPNAAAVFDVLKANLGQLGLPAGAYLVCPGKERVVF